MKPLYALLWVFIVSLIWIVSASFAIAQNSNASAAITVHVVDPTGAPVAGAHIRFVPHAPDPDCHKFNTADSNGKFSIEMPAGSYAVYTTSQGFRNSKETFTVTTPDPQTVDVVLNLGASSSVEVSVGPLSAAESAVWKLEESYWNRISALDLEGYRSLWLPDAIAWRDEPFVIAGRDNAIAWLGSKQQAGNCLQDIYFGVGTIRIKNNTAVVYYNAEYRWVDSQGRGEPGTSRVDHTWFKSSKNWKILAESMVASAK